MPRSKHARQPAVGQSGGERQGTGEGGGGEDRAERERERERASARWSRSDFRYPTNLTSPALLTGPGRCARVLRHALSLSPPLQ